MVQNRVSALFRQMDVQSCDRNQLTSAEPVVISGPERVGKLSYTDIYDMKNVPVRFGTRSSPFRYP